MKKSRGFDVFNALRNIPANFIALKAKHMGSLIEVNNLADHTYDVLDDFANNFVKDFTIPFRNLNISLDT